MKSIKEQLKNSDTEIRRRAVESLGGSHDESSLALLTYAMKDESWRVRKTATEILQNQFNVHQYINAVISLLYLDDNAGARNSAIDLLVAIGRTAIPYLIEAFDAGSRDVRKFVIDIIGEISDKRALPLLLNALKDEDENVRASAVEHLGALKEPSVVDALVGILKSGDLWTAYPAADALGRIGDRKAIPALLEALNNKTLREPVLKSLSRFSDPETIESILPLLMTGSRSVKDEILRTLNAFYKKGVSEEIIAEKIKKHLGKEAFDILLKFAWSTKSDLRLSAILLLGLMKDSRAVKPLLDMSSEEEYRNEIKRALVFIGKANPEYIMELFSDLNTLQKRFITEVAVDIENTAFYNLFEEFLQEEDGHVRALASKGIAAIGNREHVKKIQPLLDDPYVDVQEAAVDAIVQLSEGIDIEDFIQGLYDKNPRIRKNTAIILGRIGALDSIPSLGFAIKDADVDVRKAAIEALSELNEPRSEKFLMIALTDEIPEIRVSAAYALGGAGTDESTDALILLLSDKDESVRVAAAKALALNPVERVAEFLIKALSDENGFVVAAAIETLSKIRSKNARNAIVDMLSHDDEEIKRTAISGLSNFDGVEEKIKPFLNDPDWATRKITVEVLGNSADESVTRLLEEIYDDEEDPTVKKTIEVVLGARN